MVWVFCAQLCRMRTLAALLPLRCAKQIIPFAGKFDPDALRVAMETAEMKVRPPR